MLVLTVVAATGNRDGTLTQGLTTSMTSCAPAVSSPPPRSPLSSRFLPVGGFPFGVGISSNGKWAFAASGHDLKAFEVGSDQLIPFRSIPLGETGAGIALSPNNQFIVIANGSSGGSLVSVRDATSSNSEQTPLSIAAPAGLGAIEAAVSPDSHYVFVTLEGSSAVAVFHVNVDARGDASTTFLQTIHVASGPVGITMSPSGRWAYVVSEVGGGPEGRLTVINARGAESGGSSPVVRSVRVGCSPVRVITSNNGVLVWVADRGSNSVDAYLTRSLLSGGEPKPVIRVHVGPAPVGLAIVGNRNVLAVVNSNRFGGSDGDIELVTFSLKPYPRAAPEGVIPAHYFPREIVSSPDGSLLLVANYGAGQLQLISIGPKPLLTH